MKIWEITWVKFILYLLLFDDTDNRSLVSVGVRHQLPFRFFFQKTFNRLCRVNSSQFCIVTEHLTCEAYCNAVLSGLLIVTLSSWAIPVRLGVAFLLNSLEYLRAETLFGCGSFWAVVCYCGSSIILRSPLITAVSRDVTRFIPFLGNILLPVGILLDLVDSILDDRESLTDLKIIHILLVIKFISELKEVIDFLFFLLLHIFLC